MVSEDASRALAPSAVMPHQRRRVRHDALGSVQRFVVPVLLPIAWAGPVAARGDTVAQTPLTARRLAAAALDVLAPSQVMR